MCEDSDDHVQAGNEFDVTDRLREIAFALAFSDAALFRYCEVVQRTAGSFKQHSLRSTHLVVQKALSRCFLSIRYHPPRPFLRDRNRGVHGATNYFFRNTGSF